MKRSETDANGKTRRWEEPAYPDKAPDEMVVVSTTTKVLPPNRKAIACLKKVVSGLAPGAEGEPLHTAILAAKEALAEAKGLIERHRAKAQTPLLKPSPCSKKHVREKSLPFP